METIVKSVNNYQTLDWPTKMDTENEKLREEIKNLKGIVQQLMSTLEKINTVSEVEKEWTVSKLARFKEK